MTFPVSAAEGPGEKRLKIFPRPALTVNDQVFRSSISFRRRAAVPSWKPDCGAPGVIARYIARAAEKRACADLIYLAQAESAFQAAALSRAGRAGNLQSGLPRQQYVCGTPVDRERRIPRRPRTRAQHFATSTSLRRLFYLGWLLTTAARAT